MSASLQKRFVHGVPVSAQYTWESHNCPCPQAGIATKLIQEGMVGGHWVFLANCHLMTTWLPALDKIVEGMEGKKPHADFRLWLSSSPSPLFPIAILQRGIKMTTEPPKVLHCSSQASLHLVPLCLWVLQYNRGVLSISHASCVRQYSHA